MAMRDDAPLILFGAFDRHNLGDLLLGEIAAAEAGREVVFAGLAARDMRAFGGHQVQALHELLSAWPHRYREAPELLHVGGEILTTTAWEAAVMLCDARASEDAIAHYDRNAEARDQWAAAFLGTSRGLPYVVDAASLPVGSRVRFRAVGGTAFADLPSALRSEAVAALSHAEGAMVRDPLTQVALAVEGLQLSIEADPVTRVRDHFDARIAAAREEAEVAQVRRAFPGGYLALQFAAEQADDRTLATLGRGLDEVGLPVVAFRAGAAPWHDDIAAYERLARFTRQPVRCFESLVIWSICALVASSKCLVATRLHANLIASAHDRSILRSRALRYSAKLDAAIR
jgi:hypothetical protein